MTGFFADLSVNPFLLSGLVAGLLTAIPCGIVGPYVVTRRLVFLSGAVAHVAVGGIGTAIYLAHRFPERFGSVEPIHGAAVAAALAAPALATLRHRFGERADTAIGALWATGMALGILLVKLTPGYQAELMSYLFGNLTFVDWAQVRLLAGLAVVVVGVATIYHRRFLALCIDAQHAALQGVPVARTETVLLLVVSLTVVALTHVVGLILVIALLSLPAAAAERMNTRLAGTIWLSIGLCAVLTTVPRIAVYGSRVSPEAAIVLAATAVYAIALAVRPRSNRRGGDA